MFSIVLEHCKWLYILLVQFSSVANNNSLLFIWQYVHIPIEQISIILPIFAKKEDDKKNTIAS